MFDGFIVIPPIPIMHRIEYFSMEISTKEQEWWVSVFTWQPFAIGSQSKVKANNFTFSLLSTSAHTFLVCIIIIHSPHTEQIQWKWNLLLLYFLLILFPWFIHLLTYILILWREGKKKDTLKSLRNSRNGIHMKQKQSFFAHQFYI